MSRKDDWNRRPPTDDSRFADGVRFPEVAQLLPVLYPGQFPHLAAFNATKTPRADLVAIFLTGIPAGVASPQFQNFTGNVLADLLRLNVAIPPSSHPSRFGLVDGDAAGFPNGRRVFDDVVTVELQALAGRTLPLVTTYTPDKAVPAVTDFKEDPTKDLHYLTSFPYLGTPYSGFAVPAA
jgi:hypothetical protein